MVMDLAAVGVPEMTPVEVLKDNPAGRAPPAVTWKEMDPTKLLAVKLAVDIGIPTVASVVAEAAIRVAGGVETVIEIEAVAVWLADAAVIVNVVRPIVAVGVPEITPVVVLKDNPAGRVPPESE